jgi:hypothetical protein
LTQKGELVVKIKFIEKLWKIFAILTECRTNSLSKTGFLDKFSAKPGLLPSIFQFVNETGQGLDVNSGKFGFNSYYKSGCLENLHIQNYNRNN